MGVQVTVAVGLVGMGVGEYGVGLQVDVWVETGVTGVGVGVQVDVWVGIGVCGVGVGVQVAVKPEGDDRVGVSVATAGPVGESTFLLQAVMTSINTNKNDATTTKGRIFFMAGSPINMQNFQDNFVRLCFLVYCYSYLPPNL